MAGLRGNFVFSALKCWELHEECFEEGQMQILLLEASWIVLRYVECLFWASLVVKSRDFVEFRAVVEFLLCSRRM